ncbi:MAG: Exodeoxyribonuclease 7 large subunit [Candidatus Saccharibacteria bacterium]|nr:Exodeoxyribonuclease 7 large subunit [Candidatus Saccharibacteria bacterium]
MQPGSDVELSVSDFVGLLNQTLDYAYNGVVIVGELANLRVSKNRWVYFDLKDEDSTVKFFGTVYQLPGPLEDGMILKVRGQPRLHNLYGFSVNVLSMQPAGEGTIKRAAELLQVKLTTEGLFDDERKRPLPYPPARIGLIASKQSAAYADFIKILDARWGGVAIEHIDVQVQGEPAVAQIVAAFDQFNAQAEPPDVLVLIRGGGSAEDLAAFSTEQVTRAVAGSRVPTLVAIGHEIDLSLAELAADRRASTPSNAAEFLVPDRQQALLNLQARLAQLQQISQQRFETARRILREQALILEQQISGKLRRDQLLAASHRQLLLALSPEATLRRGYAIVRRDGKSLRATADLSASDIVEVQLANGKFKASVTEVTAEN